ncbi:MAG: polysaccharide deacetylase family protein [Solirubrobacteraceae bacterium]|nr:polysaccharide deacetylase family protein [Patulibacter sp.]
MTWRSRSLVVALAATAGLSPTGTAAAATTPQATSPAAPRTAPALPTLHAFSVVHGSGADARVKLTAAQLWQTTDGLGVTVQLRRRSGLTTGSKICVTFGGSAVQPPCFRKERSGWRLTIGHRVAGAVALVGRHGITTELPLSTLGLAPSQTVRWSVASAAHACKGGGALPCSDRIPSGTRTVTNRLWTPVATGCADAGARAFTGGPATRHEVAMTFDDGPSEYTAQIQAILRKAGIPATFFMIGRQIAGHEAQLRSEIADGDELADHSWSHVDLGGGGPLATTQLTDTNDAIRAATGFSPCLFRPPYGSVGSDLVARAGALGMSTVTWNVDPQDWARPGVEAIEQRILAQVKDGAIILDHDGGGDRSQTVAALPTVISELQARGYRFVTVSALLGKPVTYGLRAPR